MDLRFFEIIISVVIAVIASSGFWTFINRKIDRKSAKMKLLLGIAHDRIIQLCEPILKRGYITKEEYENIVNCLGIPYVECGGNHLAKKMLEDCKKLPLKEEDNNV